VVDAELCRPVSQSIYLSLYTQTGEHDTKDHLTMAFGVSFNTSLAYKVEPETFSACLF